MTAEQGPGFPAGPSGEEMSTGQSPKPAGVDGGPPNTGPLLNSAPSAALGGLPPWVAGSRVSIRHWVAMGA